MAGQGQNQSLSLQNQLLGGLTTTSTILCSDCHNDEATADAEGPASNSSLKPKGPHGFTNETILRANYNNNLLGPTNYNRNNFALCFLCHSPQRLVEARETDDGAATNFYDTINGKDNLHWLHLVDRDDDARATCKSCHFNVHSNVSAQNTQYNVDGVVTTTPPTTAKTHLVNFAPDIQPIGGQASPEWWINTGNRQRRCFLQCHGTDMDGNRYRPSASVDDISTIP